MQNEYCKCLLQVDRNAPLPTGEPVDKLAYEAYPEDYHGPKEDVSFSGKYIQKEKNKNNDYNGTISC
jgi:hypothetical protein